MSHQRETELLLACARAVLSPDASQRVRALAGQIHDWDYVVEMASEQRIVPLVSRHLAGATDATERVPAVETLIEGARSIGRHNLRLTRELVQILELFDRHGIPAIPYKGPALATALYGDISLRQFGDLDIIVPLSEVRRAKALLMARGYVPELNLDPSAEDDYLRAENDYKMFDPGRRILVELHWGITNKSFSFSLQPDDLWRRLDTVPAFGARVLALPPEELLLILCVHGSTHHWQRLAWICDIAELLRTRDTLNWDHVLGSATRLGGRRMLLLGLGLAKELLAAPLPPGVLRRVEADRAVTSLASLVRECLFRELSSAQVAGEWDHFAIKMRERMSDKVRVAVQLARLRMTPTSMDEAFLPLSKQWSFVRYGIRPFRLAREYGLEPLKRFASGFR